MKSLSGDFMMADRLKQLFYRDVMQSGTGWLRSMNMSVLLIWGTIFTILPWFLYRPAGLGAALVYLCAVAIVTRVSSLLLLLMSVGIAANLLMTGLAAWLFGGSGKEILADVLLLTVKLVLVSMAGISAWTSLDTEKIRDGLLRLPIPAYISYSILYGYRILPSVIEQFEDVLVNFRLRSGIRPKGKGKGKALRLLFVRFTLCIAAFYPMILHTAKRTRTMAEAMEMKGLGYSGSSRQARKPPYPALKIGRTDLLFLFGSLLATAVCIAADRYIIL